MRIAIISDTHGNLPALESVLRHAEQKRCEIYWNLGDNVGYGPFPEECVSRLKGLPGESVIGNYDRKVLAFPKKRKSWKKKKQPQKYLAFQWAYNNLSKKSRQYLKKLPEGASPRFMGYHFSLTHGSPFSDEAAILPATPPDQLREIGRCAGAPIILCGHTHTPFAFAFEDWWFINPGSIGRPGDGDPRASYAILRLKKKNWSIKHYRLNYDIDRTVSAVYDQGLPEEFARMFKAGRSLDDLSS